MTQEPKEVPKIAKPVGTSRNLVPVEMGAEEFIAWAEAQPSTYHLSPEEVQVLIDWHPTLESFIQASFEGPDFQMTPEQIEDAGAQIRAEGGKTLPATPNQDSGGQRP